MEINILVFGILIKNNNHTMKYWKLTKNLAFKT